MPDMRSIQDPSHAAKIDFFSVAVGGQCTVPQFTAAAWCSTGGCKSWGWREPPSGSSMPYFFAMHSARVN
jgi:hypothetical protein